MTFLVLSILFIVACCVAGVIAAFVVILKPMSQEKARKILDQRAREQLARDAALERAKAQQGL